MSKHNLALAALLTAAIASCATPAQTGPTATLAGTWRQDAAACGAATPVAELIFSADGRFSVTWFPFETYKDYWGAWRYDAATHVLTLAVENGNYVPPDIAATGEISFNAHQLALGAVSLGSPHEGERCTAPFRR